MFSIRIYIRIILQVTLILIVAGIGIAGIISGKAIILGTVAVFIAAWLAGLLVYFLNASNRRIQLFLDAIEDNESMLYFPENTGSEEQRRLHAAFNRIHRLMTENKQQEFDRELYRKEYESYDKLMHVLTHEIMNSIAPIVSLSGTLLSYFQTKGNAKNSDEISDATIRKTIRGLDTIKSQGQSLMNFTDSYRQLARLQQPKPKPFSLPHLIRNIEMLFHSDLHRLQIQFSIDLFREEIEVNADEELLSQVLINLLKNAMQALEGQENGEISLSVKQLRTTTYIEVKDNGPGIPHDILEDIFVPFFTTKETGTGIGLSLSRQIIRMHGGELQVSSRPYFETLFTISLPLTPGNYNT
nr:ATP-binding protein [Parabacteroides goldsteinii]